MTARRILAWVAVSLAGLLLLVVLAAVGLNTSAGKALLLRQAAAFTTATGLNIRAARIDGSIYGRMTLIGVEVHDLHGLLATAPAIIIDWQPLAALHRQLSVREALAAQIRLLRRPALGPSPPNEPLLPDIDIAIGRLAVRQLILEPAVSGQRQIVALAGSTDLANGRARINLTATALRSNLLHGGDRFELRLDAVPAANRLLIAARLIAPAGGLVDSYAKLGKPLTFNVDGRGDWTNWTGALRGTTGDQPLADIALTGRSGIFTARGRLQPTLLLVAGPAQNLTAGGIDLDATARLDQRRVTLRSNIGASAFAASADGLIDLANNRFGNFRLGAQLLQPGSIAANLRGSDIRVAATLDGPFSTPLLDYRVSAATLAFNTTGIEGLVASGRATVDARRTLIPIAARAKRVTGLNAAAGGLLTNLAVDGDLAWSNGRLLSDNLKLRSDRLDATAIVVADIGKGTYTGALKGRVNDYQVAGLGRIDVVTDARLVTGPRGGFGITGNIRAVTRHLDNASVAAQLGGNAVVTAQVGFDEAGIASLRDLRLSAPRFRIIDGNGSYRPDGRIAFAARATSSQYGPLTVAASGSVAQPVVRLRADRPNVGIQLDNVVAELTGSAAGYRVRAQGGSPYGPFAADVLLRTAKTPLAIDITSARFAGVGIHGSVVQTAAGPFTGALQLAGSGLNGTVRLAAAGRDQRADLDVRAAAARLPGPTPVTIGSGSIRATVTLAVSAPAATGTASFSDVRAGTLLVAKAQTRLNYRGGSGTVALIASGTSAAPFTLAAQAALAPTRITANATGSFNAIPFRLAAPAVAVKSGKAWQLAPVTLIVPQGRAQLSGQYGRDIVVNAVLDNLDLAIADVFKPGLGLGGKASGTIAATLPAGNATPVVDAQLNVAHLTRSAAYTISEPVDIASRIRLSSAGGEISAVVRRSGSTVGQLQVRLAPLGIGSTITQRVLAAPLTGGIRYNGPAEVLWALTGTAGQQLSGPVAIAADFGGHLDRPALNGVVRASMLRYENQTYGTVISNLAVQGRFTQSRFELTTLTGRAGSGTVAAHGTVGLEAASGFPLDLALTFDRAQLARSDALGATASGTLAITSNHGAGLISGTLTIPEARYQIIRQGAAEVVELAGVRRRNAPPAPVAAPGPAPSNFRLDLRIRADNRIYVSGMGLEAEWQTDMRVTGSATQPVVIGKLSIVRGTYSFAGRRFDLAQDGAITFDGGPFTNPQLALSASTTVTGVTATINITGRAERPEIAFTSTPALPQDEVLARLLFGGSVTSLSPTQALQLAAALNSLRGSTSAGFNPLGKLRSATGIDRLRILGADQASGRSTALAAGKYITKNIYVEVVTDARGFTATQLEIALTKTLSLLSATGSLGGSNVNLRYSRSY